MLKNIDKEKKEIEWLLELRICYSFYPWSGSERSWCRFLGRHVTLIANMPAFRGGIFCSHVIWTRGKVFICCKFISNLRRVIFSSKVIWTSGKTFVCSKLKYFCVNLFKNLKTIYVKTLLHWMFSEVDKIKIYLCITLYHVI